MSCRGSEAGSPTRRLGKRKFTAQVATGSTRKSRKSAGESSAHSQQQKTAKRTGKKDGKKKPPKARLLNAGEREQVVDCVIEEDVLSYVLKEVPDKLIDDLFPERKFFLAVIAAGEDSDFSTLCCYQVFNTIQGVWPD